MKRKSISIKVPLKFFIIPGAVLLLVFIVIFLILINRPMLVDVEKMPFTDSQEYYFTGTGFLYIEDSVVKYIGFDGESYPALLNNTDVHITGSGRSMHIVYDKSSICVIGNKEATLVDGELVAVRCCDDYIACLVRKDGSEHIELYDKNSKLIDSIETKKKTVEFGFTGTEKQKLYTITVEFVTENFTSIITTYDPSQGATTGIISVQNQLIEDIVFDSKSIFVKGTENIIRFDAQTNKECYRLVANGYKMEDCAIAEENAYFMLRSVNEEQDSLKMYRTSLKNVSNMGILPLYNQKNNLGTFYYSDFLYSFTPDRLIRYSTSGKKRESEKLGFDATEVVRLDDDLVLIKSGEFIYTARLEPANVIKKMFIK